MMAIVFRKMSKLPPSFFWILTMLVYPIAWITWVIGIKVVLMNWIRKQISFTYVSSFILQVTEQKTKGKIFFPFLSH